MDCTHNVFTATVVVTRLSDTTPMQFRADIKITCAECLMPLEFIGLPLGYDFQHPTRSLDGFSLRAPLKFADSQNKIAS